MPTRRLPKKLLTRLTAAAPWLERYTGKMRNIDPRRGLNKDSKGPADTENWGGRVRQLRISHNFPRQNFVVLKVDDHGENGEAEKTIREVHGIVDDHNAAKGAGRYPYILRKPFAYPISEKLIAMARTRKPNIAEMLPDGTFGYPPEIQTRRGKAYFKRLARKHGITAEQLIKVAKLVERRTSLEPDDVIVTGFKNGKFELTPAPDYDVMSLLLTLCANDHRSK